MTEDAPFPRPTRLTIDTAAIVANRRTIAARVGPGVETAGVVKADGYGTGATAAAKAMAADGCRTFFVAHVGEGVALRAALAEGGRDRARIFVLNGLLPGTETTLAEHGLAPVLGSFPEIEDWAAFGREEGLALPSAIHVDTGMNRHGLDLDEARALADRPDLAAAAGAELVMSHLACADEPGHPLNLRQLERFRAIRPLFPGLSASLANSSGVHLGAEYHFDLVRPGVALYGGAIRTGEASPMRPVVGLEATILQVRDARAGESVGYGARQTPKRASRLAVLSVGYADGFHRTASSADERLGGRGFLHGRPVPIVGRISMDLMMVDVTDVPQAARGDVVELIGPNVTLQEAAAAMGTIDYEVLTSLGRRYERIRR
ncbi:MAG: alanine racemase [Hyphomicrobiales bacterium]|nr:alanine racemase [Hyphomicrobiales bacterium]